MRYKGVSIRLIAVIIVLTLLIASMCTAESGTANVKALAEGADIRIMSYNILHPDWSRVPVDGRADAVSEILTYYMPDVVALQEAGAKWHKALKPLLVDNGIYAFACRQSNADGFVYNATCFLYNPATVRPVEEYILDLDYRDAARVFSVAVFERLADGAHFVVANTHPAPRNEQKKYAKNMADLTAFASDTAQKYADLPVMIAGDFNTPDMSEMYLGFMEQACVRDAKYEAEILVRDCATYFDDPDALGAENMDYCVDHIFVNGRAAVRLFDTVIDLGVRNASDHTPIYADIGFER